MENKVFCESCDKKVNYYITVEEVTRKVKDIEITLKVPVTKCITCKKEVISLNEEIEAQDMFFSEYRTRKGLIQTKEIIRIRKEIDRKSVV